MKGIDGNADADRQFRSFGLTRKTLADAGSGALGGLLSSLRQHHCKFVAPVTGCSVHRTGVHPQDIREPAERAATDLVSVLIVDDLQAVKVEQHDGRSE